MRINMSKPLQSPLGAAVPEAGVTTRAEIESRLGSPSAWIESRRVLVYAWAVDTLPGAWKRGEEFLSRRVRPV